jgi:CHAT domain-containing protein/tetratricopeptide (TPR) repeat protein
MKKVVGFWLLWSSSLGVGAQSATHLATRQGLERHRQGLEWFQHPNPTPRMDSLALARFGEALRYLDAGFAYAGVRFDCQQKIGILHQGQGRPAQAVAAYRQAIRTALQYRLPDSLLYRPYLYCGSAYYALDAFDQALDYFEQAEKLFQRYPHVGEAERLYNSFGVIYYERSNYKQSVNSFRKALQVHRERGPEDPQTVYTFTSNIATALRHLDRPDSALALYRSLLPLGLYTDELYLNLGTLFLERHQPDSALHYLRRVRDPKRQRSILYGNLLAEAAYQQGDKAGSRRQLLQLLRISGGTGESNSQVGLTYKLLGDVERDRGDGIRALAYYQQSIRALSNQFDDPDVTRNPVRFTEVFKGFSLYATLIAKAECLGHLYERRAEARWLAQAADAYESAFRLAEYIKKTYATEEARLFLSGKVLRDYRLGVARMVRAYEATRQRVYLERAFSWSEQSKASALFLNLKENRVKQTALPASLRRQEARLRAELSRLFLKIDRAAGDAEQQKLYAQVRDHELTLARLQDQFNDYADYYSGKFRADTLDVARIRRRLRAGQVLLSYFDGGQDWYGFVLNATSIRYFSVPQTPGFRAVLHQFVRAVRHSVPGQPYQGHDWGRALYSVLIRPAQLPRGSRLIIVPHQELTALPFEALETRTGAYLLTEHPVVYQYSALFMEDSARQPPDLKKSLAVAPFDNDTFAAYVTLPASAREVRALEGTRLLGSAATKSSVLSSLRDVSIVHLATHAVSDPAQPLYSHVVFYPETATEFRWYAHEIQLASLRHVQLVVLSACDSGNGPLLSGEGVMSLSRAISYAGCPNLITSLWKAEDEATCFISLRFYEHLKRGKSYEVALQQAKLDLLNEPEYVQYHAPTYWAHLIFIGHSFPEETISLPYGVLLTGLLLVGLLLVGFGWLLKKRKAERKSRKIMPS